MQIKKYNQERPGSAKENETIFYVQSVGKNAGRPLKNPIPNSWEIITDRKIDFQILYIVFESRILESFWRGSVITFISLADYKNIIAPILKNAIHENRIINEHYLQIEKLDLELSKQIKIKSLLLEMKKVISHQVFKKIKVVI